MFVYIYVYFFSQKKTKFLINNKVLIFVSFVTCQFSVCLLIIFVHNVI